MKYGRPFQSLAVLALLILPTTVRADEIALWNFNDPPATLTVDRGTGTLTTTANPANVTDFSGTTFHAQMGDPAGRALAIQGGAGLVNNGSILELRASTVGFSGISISWAWQRSDTGFNSIQSQYSTDGVNFQNLGDPDTPQTNDFNGHTVIFNAAAGVHQNPSFAFRWILNGATNGNGNVRFDNLALLGNPQPVPEPATLLLLGIGLGGIVARGINRRKRQ